MIDRFTASGGCFRALERVNLPLGPVQLLFFLLQLAVLLRLALMSDIQRLHLTR